VRHSLDQLLAVVYRFYPRGMNDTDAGYDDTEEHRRLVAARRHAGTGEPYERWRAMLRRLDACFPGRSVTNRSLHLPTGSIDACYSAWLDLPPSAGEHARNLGFLVSFLVPSYVVYSSRMTHLDPRDPASEGRSIRREFSFTFTGDEEPYVREIVREIEATYSGYEPMPPDVGNVIVPDVVAGLKLMGETTLYHCLFSDDW
jgi:hypothetical protein